VEPKQQFGTNLRRLRTAAGLTQMELSNRSGLDMAEISRLERGLKDPRLSTVVRLAAGLQTDPSELVRGIRPAT
jgi:transcriptional regulator with XRE-family HTH domain